LHHKAQNAIQHKELQQMVGMTLVSAFVILVKVEQTPKMKKLLTLFSQI
jgi:hypothetical protein